MDNEQTRIYFDRLNSVNTATQAQINAMIVEEIKAKLAANKGTITYSDLAIIAVKYTPSAMNNRMAMLNKFRIVAADKVINLTTVCDEFRLFWHNPYQHTLYNTIKPQELFYTLKANKNLTITTAIENCTKDGKHYFQAACKLTTGTKKEGVLAKDAFTLMAMLELTNHGFKYTVSMKLVEQLYAKYCM